MVAELEAYGLAKERLQLISDYLCHRKHRTKMGSTYNDWANVIRGIPQGSILGPLLFNIFINNIFLVVEKSDICNFVDDNLLYVHENNLPLILSNLEHDMKNLFYWFEINSRKFQFMILWKKNCLKHSLKIGSIESDKVDLQGITIDKALNFKKTYRKFKSHYQLQASCFKTNQKILDIR